MTSNPTTETAGEITKHLIETYSLVCYLCHKVAVAPISTESKCTKTITTREGEKATKREEVDYAGDVISKSSLPISFILECTSTWLNPDSVFESGLCVGQSVLTEI